MNFRDVELLSAYLDGRLKPSDAARLESRLSSDPALKATLEDLRQTRGLLRRLPQRRAPRDFRLTPKMAGVRPPEPRSYPVFRFATALAALLFVAAVALNALTPFAASHLTAAAPAYGMGGGGYGGGAPESNPGPGAGGSGQFTQVPPQAAMPAANSAPAATEEPTLQAFTTLAGTPTPEALTMAQATSEAQQDASRAAASKAAPLANATRGPENELPIPLPLVMGLGVLMIALALAAWLLRRSSERRIRSQWNQK
jgi:hypothetical protein